MTALLAPPIRVRSAPVLDPPYDDEGPLGAAPPPSPSPVAQPHLPLDWSRLGVTSAPVPSGAARSGPAGGVPGPGGPGPAAPGPAAPRPAAPGWAAPQGPAGTRRPWSPARGAVMHFLSLCLEVLNGYRPPTHLRPFTAPAEFEGIAEQIGHALKRSARSARFASPRPPRAVPPRAVPPKTAPGRSASQVRLRELRVCEPRPGVAEAAAVLGHAGRVWALALRLERRPAGWLCTAARVI